MLFGAKEREKAAPAELFAPQGPAEIARPTPILPSSAANISFDSMLFLQSEQPAEPAIQAPSATELFLQEIQKDPIERMREQILEALGLTEEGLAQLPPDERRMVEEQISAMIEERLRQSNGADRAPETQAEALMQSLKA